MATISFSLPILSIPLYYTLAVFPHGYAIHKASAGSLKNHDNRNPRGTAQLENIKKRLSPAEFAAFERGESCHRNHMENMPLYIATLFAAILAENRVGEGEIGLINFVLGWMVVRVLYTVNYLATGTSQGWTRVRSLLYFFGTGWAFLILWRSAMALA